jgi:uncharacterized protein YcbK (DUF882 family)
VTAKRHRALAAHAEAGHKFPHGLRITGTLGVIVRLRRLFIGRRRLLAMAIVLAALVPSAGHASGPGLAEADPFAFDGRPADGVGMPERRPADARILRLHHHWTGEDLAVTYRIGDAYLPSAMVEINQFLRDWRCDQATAMDPALVDRLYELQMALGGRRTMRVISAYRSEAYNASLLRAGRTVDPDSQHMFGRAVDVFVPGVPLAELKEVAERTGHGGTGYYPFSGPRFIHIDTGPERHWSEMDPAMRRKLKLPVPERKPLRIDCSLTIAEVLREVPVAEIMAALPSGASAQGTGQFHPSTYARPWAEGDGREATTPSGIQPAAPRPEALCRENGGMAALNPADLLSQ